MKPEADVEVVCGPGGPPHSGFSDSHASVGGCGPNGWAAIADVEGEVLVDASMECDGELDINTTVHSRRFDMS